MERNSKGQIKDVIKQEYIKCASDPVYFMKKYCVIQHPIQGKIPFHLYYFQEKPFRCFPMVRNNCRIQLTKKSDGSMYRVESECVKDNIGCIR